MANSADGVVVSNNCTDGDAARTDDSFTLPAEYGRSWSILRIYLATTDVTLPGYDVFLHFNSLR